MEETRTPIERIQIGLEKIFFFATTRHNIPERAVAIAIAKAIRTFTRIPGLKNTGDDLPPTPVDGFFSNTQKVLVEYARDPETKDIIGMRFIQPPRFLARPKKLIGSFTADPYGFNEKVRRGGKGSQKRRKGNTEMINRMQARNTAVELLKVMNRKMKDQVEKIITEKHVSGNIGVTEGMVLRGLWAVFCEMDNTSDSSGFFAKMYELLKADMERLADEYEQYGKEEDGQDQKEDVTDVEVRRRTTIRRYDKHEESLTCTAQKGQAAPP